MFILNDLLVLKGTRTCLTRGTKEEVLEKALASKCTCSDIEILIVENGVKEIDQTSKNPRKGIRTTMISPNATWVISDCFRTRSKSNPGLLVMFLPESIYIYILFDDLDHIKPIFTQKCTTRPASYTHSENVKTPS